MSFAEAINLINVYNFVHKTPKILRGYKKAKVLLLILSFYLQY